MYECAFDEFHETGEVGPQYLALVGRSLRAVIRRRGIPPPSGNARWSPGEIDDALHDFLVERGMERLAQLYISAVDEPSLRRLVQTAVHRFLADRSRRTQRGKLIRRFRQDLKESQRFRLAAGGGVERWTLADGHDHAARSTGDPRALAQTLSLGVMVHENAGRPDRADAYAAEAVEIREALRPGCELAEALTEQARLQLLRGLTGRRSRRWTARSASRMRSAMTAPRRAL